MIFSTLESLCDLPSWTVTARFHCSVYRDNATDTVSCTCLLSVSERAVVQLSHALRQRETVFLAIIKGCIVTPELCPVWDMSLKMIRH